MTDGEYELREVFDPATMGMKRVLVPTGAEAVAQSEAAGTPTPDLRSTFGDDPKPKPEKPAAAKPKKRRALRRKAK